MTIALQVDIEAPPETVWTFIADPLRRQLWMPDVAEIDYPAQYDTEHPVGTRFRQIMGANGRGKIWLGEISACEKFRLLAFVVGDGKVRQEVNIRLRPMGTGTRLGYCTHVTPAGHAGRAMQIALRPMKSRVLARHLEMLRRLAEDAAAGPGADMAGAQ